MKRLLLTEKQRQMVHRGCKVVCAWCRRHMLGHPRNLNVSHAICPSCSAFMLADAGYVRDNLSQDELEEVEFGGEG